MNGLLPTELARILSSSPALRRAYVVGGCVRDWHLGLPVKDYDIEVFGVSYEQLEKALASWGRADVVGRSFGVVKLRTPSGLEVDFSIPRRDSKVAPGHQGFAITFEPDISPREAAARRDFTINSLMFDPRDNQVLDFFGGLEDLRRRILRHTSQAFSEDPLRVLRGLQFAGRFRLRPAPETVEICRQIKGTHSELAVERIREEWFKWAEKSQEPSLGLRFLDASGWLENYPGLAALRGVPQDPEWHPEGDVFTHTCCCCDALVSLRDWQEAEIESKIVYMLAVLTHDFGKPAVTHQAVKDGRLRLVSPGHEAAGNPVVMAFLRQIDAPPAIINRIIPLVENHLAHLQTITDRGVRRLAKRLEPENLHGLFLVIMADSLGRPPHPPEMPEGLRVLQAKAVELSVKTCAPKPVLMGRHLLAIGFTPGKIIGEILAAAYEAQLEGRILNLIQALQWLETQNQWTFPEAVRLAIQRQIESHMTNSAMSDEDQRPRNTTSP
jgi:tRNA nucleotidyltransferase (CCA-adding enzyme)